MSSRWLVLAVLVVTVLAACSRGGNGEEAPQHGPGTGSPSTCATPAPADDLRPETGAWFGVSIDWDNDSLTRYAQRLGRTPAVVVNFARFPLSATDIRNVDGGVEQAAAAGSMLLLTLEPTKGLGRVTDPVAIDLARRLDRYNHNGVPVIVRFAHEMNGSWYPWGQDPTAYIAAFRRVATAVHRYAPGSAIMWAPSYGGGYPFAGGKYQAKPGSARAKRLDTNGDGKITAKDDPYAPYWPGRQYVDWVGMSLYFWGNSYPWGKNHVPAPGAFEDMLRGRYHIPGRDERMIPDFYGRYGEQMDLPVAITETAALYIPGRGGADELSIKQHWWQQVLAPDLSRTMPQLKMINWFEWNKYETEVHARVDWTVTHTARVRTAFQHDLPTWLRFAADVPRCH